MSWRSREMLVAAAVIMVAWLAVMAGLSRWQERSARHGLRVPALPHYPGTERIPEQVVSTTTDQHRYWFHFDGEYPSTAVYGWYRDALAAAGGWTPLNDSEPAWTRTREKTRVADALTAAWLSRDELFQIELQLISVTPLENSHGTTRALPREPGMKVYVTLRRTLTPWIYEARRKSGGG